MSSERETIYVALLDEGIDVWRPVAARKLAADTYCILDQNYDREVEIWQFEPGAVVRCRREQRKGRQILVATDIARREPTGVTAEESSTYETPSWRGKLKLSLVICPVCLYSASRIWQESTRNIDGELSIEMFVNQRNVDFIFMQSPYYLVPDGSIAEETYAVIYESMRRKGVVALSRLRFEGEERQVVVLPGKQIFRLYPLRHLDEIVEERTYSGGITSVALDSEMILLAEQLVDLKRGNFQPTMSMTGETGRTRTDLEISVDKAIRTGKVISLKHALERSVNVRSTRNGKSQNEGSG